MLNLKLSTRFSGYNTRVWAVVIIVTIITFLAYLPALKNDFVNWDDQKYVYENQHIKSIDLKFFKWMFTSFHATNWHPLTWLSHAIDYSIWGLNPMGHHLTSIIFHSLNTLLVVILIVRLVHPVGINFIPNGVNYTKYNYQSPSTVENNKHSYTSSIIVGAATGLLFGLHPIHVESVAWVSERKDVLYAFFFLLSIILYLKYTSSGLKKQRILNYSLCLLFFILALMSKPMAVTLPVVLLILDFYPLERLNLKSKFKVQKKILIEKIPFIILSISSSVVTILAQQKAIHSLELYPVGTRIWVGIRALGFYLVKMVLPIDLSPLYPHPRKISFPSFEYICAFLLVIGITIFCIWSWRRKQKFWSVVWAYYVVTLLPVLGIIQVGGQAAADRYTYLPSLGPFLLFVLSITFVWGKVVKKHSSTLRKLFTLFPIILIFVFLSSLTLKQIEIWKDSITLWDTNLRLFPNSHVAYKNRGVAYFNLNNFKQAIDDCNKAIELNPYYARAYDIRGNAYLMMGNHQKALIDLNKAIELDPESELFHFDRRLACQLAIKDYSLALKQNPTRIEFYINRGASYAMVGQFNQALEDFNKAISLNPQLAIAYYNRGLIYIDSGNYQDAVKDFQTAARLGDKKAQDYLKSEGIGW